jgi:hypothetical protein
VDLVAGFTVKAVPAWAKDYLAPGRALRSEGLAGFVGAVTGMERSHQPTVIAGGKPKKVPGVRRLNAVPGNPKTDLSNGYHAFDFRKYAARGLTAFRYRFNRRCDRSSWTNPCFSAACRRTGMAQDPPGFPFLATPR